MGLGDEFCRVGLTAIKLKQFIVSRSYWLPVFNFSVDIFHGDENTCNILSSFSNLRLLQFVEAAITSKLNDE